MDKAGPKGQKLVSGGVGGGVRWWWWWWGSRRWRKGEGRCKKNKINKDRTTVRVGLKFRDNPHFQGNSMPHALLILWAHS